MKYVQCLPKTVEDKISIKLDMSLVYHNFRNVAHFNKNMCKETLRK